MVKLWESVKDSGKTKNAKRNFLQQEIKQKIFKICLFLYIP